jgi:Alkylmercury lyase
MLLFRSEEEVDAWCAATGEARGEVVPLAGVWALAQAWYGDRMDPAFRGRTAGQARAIFAGVGLTSTFWQADAP